jgi:hypothetical protein
MGVSKESWAGGGANIGLVSQPQGGVHPSIYQIDRAIEIMVDAMEGTMGRHGIKRGITQELPTVMVAGNRPEQDVTRTGDHQGPHAI